MYIWRYLADELADWTSHSGVEIGKYSSVNLIVNHFAYYLCNSILSITTFYQPYAI